MVSIVGFFNRTIQNRTLLRDVGNHFLNLKYATGFVSLGLPIPIKHALFVHVYLDQQIHHVSGHLLDQDLDDSQYLSLGSGQSGGVNVLLRLRVGLSCVEAVNLENGNIGETHLALENKTGFCFSVGCAWFQSVCVLCQIFLNDHQYDTCILIPAPKQ